MIIETQLSIEMFWNTEDIWEMDRSCPSNRDVREGKDKIWLHHSIPYDKHKNHVLKRNSLGDGDCLTSSGLGCLCEQVLCSSAPSPPFKCKWASLRATRSTNRITITTRPGTRRHLLEKWPLLILERDLLVSAPAALVRSRRRLVNPLNHITQTKKTTTGWLTTKNRKALTSRTRPDPLNS